MGWSWGIQETDWAKSFLLILGREDSLNWIEPESGFSIAPIILRRVDFPDPLGPINPIKSCSRMDMDKSLKTGVVS